MPKINIDEISYEEFEKEMLLATIRILPVNDLTELYINVFGHGYLHEQLIKFVEEGNDEQVKKVYDNLYKGYERSENEN